MSIEPEDRLTESLKGLTWWSGPTPGLWEQAIKSTRTASQTRGDVGGVGRILGSRWAWVGVPMAAMLLIAIMVARLNDAGQPSLFVAAQPEAAKCPNSPPSPTSGVRIHDTGVNERCEAEAAGTGSFIAQERGLTTTIPTGTAERHVVCKAAIDLQAEDVRGVYLRIQALVPNEAQGDYVEQSQLHDSGGQISGYLTLRVRGERLNEVLNTLRGLATVVREQSDATDVTAQVVDIEARLRNERRVEQELLALMDKRKDAPLEDVLKLSNSLADVRGRIEKLTAEQQRVARQVALATVVVSVQAKAAMPVQTGTRRLGEQFGAAWRDGVAFLVDTLAAMVRILIGGLIWWVLLIVGLWMLRRWHLRRVGMPNDKARMAKE